MKIIVLGTNHAGTSFIYTLLKMDPSLNVVTYDRNSDISFLGCGIALWVSQEFEDPQGLFYSSKTELEGLGAKVFLEHEVVHIDRINKRVRVKNLNTGQEFEDYYDKLVFAGGTWPIVPPFPGVNLENVLLSKIFKHAKVIKAKALDTAVKNVVVVGAGYIGIELVEAFHKFGKKVTLIDMQERVIPNYFDDQFTSKLEKKMKEEGINMRFGEGVKSFESKDGIKVSSVVTDKGEYPADLVILAIGFRPQTQLLSDLEMLPNSSLKVDEFQRSLSDEDIYVIGDCAAMLHNATGEYVNIALATNAVKTGIVAANHLVGRSMPFPGLTGTNAISVFGFHFSSTGFTKAAAQRTSLKDNVEEVYIEDWDRPEFMQHKHKVWLKLTYTKDTRRIVGAQVGSYGEESSRHTEVTFALSLAIQQKLTLEQLALIDVYFLPHFNKTFNFVFAAVLKALNIGRLE